MSAHQIEADDLLTDAFTDARKRPTAPRAFRQGITSQGRGLHTGIKP
jgi:hypothetical protein